MRVRGESACAATMARACRGLGRRRTAHARADVDDGARAAPPRDGGDERGEAQHLVLLLRAHVAHVLRVTEQARAHLSCSHRWDRRCHHRARRPPALHEERKVLRPVLRQRQVGGQASGLLIRQGKQRRVPRVRKPLPEAISDEARHLCVHDPEVRPKQRCVHFYGGAGAATVDDIRRGRRTRHPDGLVRSVRQLGAKNLHGGRCAGDYLR